MPCYAAVAMVLVLSSYLVISTYVSHQYSSTLFDCSKTSVHLSESSEGGLFTSEAYLHPWPTVPCPIHVCLTLLVYFSLHMSIVEYVLGVTAGIGQAVNV